MKHLSTKHLQDLEAELAQLESEDPAVAAAKKRLDEVTRDIVAASKRTKKTKTGGTPYQQAQRIATAVRKDDAGQASAYAQTLVAVAVELRRERLHLLEEIERCLMCRVTDSDEHALDALTDLIAEMKERR